MRISNWSSDVCSSDLGYNIESLTVADVTENHAVSRITIVTKGPPHVIEQIIHQLDRLIPVHSVNDLSAKGPHVEREMALVKVAGTGDHRIEALRLAEVYRSEEHTSELQSLMRN